MRQVPSLHNVMVTLADTNAYQPYDPVTGHPNQRATALSDQQNVYLNAEWDRQVALGRTPTGVLGEKPPWKKEVFYYVDGDSFVLASACHTCNSDAHALTTRCFDHCP